MRRIKFYKNPEKGYSKKEFVFRSPSLAFFDNFQEEKRRSFLTWKRFSGWRMILVSLTDLSIHIYTKLFLRK